MPQYSYQCKKCNKEFNVHQSIKDKPLINCSEVCNCQLNGKLQRLISPVGIKFKGSGFYITDYKNNQEDKK